MVYIPALEAGVRGFEAHRSDQIIVALSHSSSMAEHTVEAREVLSSSLRGDTIRNIAKLTYSISLRFVL